MLDLFNNKTAFLRMKPKMGFTVVILIFFILLYLIIYISTKEIYDHYQTKGIVNCQNTCTIKTLLPSNFNFEQIALNNKYLDYTIISKELIVDEENYQTYFELTLSTEEDLTNNEIVDLNFYYNKQRLIVKIKEKMF